MVWSFDTYVETPSDLQIVTPIGEAIVNSDSRYPKDTDYTTPSLGISPNARLASFRTHFIFDDWRRLEDEFRIKGFPVALPKGGVRSWMVRDK